MWNSIFELAAKLMGFIARRNEDKNAPDVKAAQKQQDAVNAEAAEIRAVATKDADAVRKNLAE